VNFIIYDLEATCWRGRPPKGVQEIIEVGAYKVNQYGEVLDTFSSFIRPVVNTVLSSFCKQLTSIRQIDVNNASTFPVVIESFKDWINIYDEDYIFISWGAYDKQFLLNDCELHKLDDEWLDNFMDLKQEYHDLKNTHKHRGLKKVVNNEGFEFTGIQHRAISDAENLSKIFVKYIDEWQY
jgi:inhibitor of KinA sporulation pathway (predicted exonuclease)